jgi:hypothetical protein
MRSRIVPSKRALPSLSDFTNRHPRFYATPPPVRTMISRSAIGRNAQLALRRQCCAQPANRRGFAAAVSGSTSFSYETADVGGVKVASRDIAGPTTKLAVVAKAGTRYESAPGVATGLEYFAFKVRLSNVFRDQSIFFTSLSDCASLDLEHRQALCPSDHKRVRAAWRSIDCIPHERGLGCRGQLPARRSAILYRIAW